MKERKIYIRGVIVYFISVILLAFIDQMAKFQAVAHLKNQQPIVIIDQVFELFYLENTGTAWGMMSGAINFFVIITIVIMVAVTWLTFRIPSDKKYIPMRIITILVCAGAIGNLIDRVVYGYVVDFLYFKLINFPVFNIADCYVSVAMVLMVIFVLFYYKEEDYIIIWRKDKKHV